MYKEKQYPTRKELEFLFGEMIDIPPEEEKEANRLWLESGLADGSIKIIKGINLYEI